jgi:hypothetical protein
MKESAAPSAASSLRLLLALTACLAFVAVLTPTPWWATDRDIYVRVGKEFFVSDCTEIHCFRVLVPWVVERFPGSSAFWWKAYAVLCQAAAGVAMCHLVTRFGASRRAAVQVAWLTALGSGALYTLFDPHTSDPLMHLLLPMITMELVDLRVPRAGALATLGVFAKEIAVVPLVVMALARAVQQLPGATKVLAVATAVVSIWLGWQLALRTLLGYTSDATRLELHLGSFVAFWAINLSPTLVAASIVMSLGGLWLLWFVGLWWGPRSLRQLTFAAVPVILIFCAVQQPDRALWNFAFLFMPAVAVALGAMDRRLAWVVVGACVLANLRVGAQLAFVPPARLSLALSAALVFAALLQRRLALAR